MMRPARLLLIHHHLLSHIIFRSTLRHVQTAPTQLERTFAELPLVVLLYCNSNGRKHITQLFLMTRSTTHCTPPHIILLATIRLIGRCFSPRFFSRLFFSVTPSRALVLPRIRCCVWKRYEVIWNPNQFWGGSGCN